MTLTASGFDELQVERMKRAIVEFQGLIDKLFAPVLQIVTKRRKLKVLPHPSLSATDGKTVWLRIPLELGDSIEHEKHLCGQRDPSSWKMACPACEVMDNVIATVFHEAAHIVFDSFKDIPDADKKRLYYRFLREKVLAERPDLEEQLEEKVMTSDLTKTAMGLAGVVDGWLPMVVNVLEDIFVNEEMFQDRVGTETSIRRSGRKAVMEGALNFETGEITKWQESTPDCRGLMTVYCLGQDMTDLIPGLGDDVQWVQHDPEVLAVIAQVKSAEDANARLELAVRVLTTLRAGGLCIDTRSMLFPPRPPDAEPQEGGLTLEDPTMEPEEGDGEAHEESDAQDDDGDGATGDESDEGDDSEEGEPGDDGSESDSDGEAGDSDAGTDEDGDGASDDGDDEVGDGSGEEDGDDDGEADSDSGDGDEDSGTYEDEGGQAGNGESDDDSEDDENDDDFDDFDGDEEADGGDTESDGGDGEEDSDDDGDNAGSGGINEEDDDDSSTNGGSSDDDEAEADGSDAESIQDDDDPLGGPGGPGFNLDEDSPDLSQDGDPGHGEKIDVDSEVDYTTEQELREQAEKELRSFMGHDDDEADEELTEEQQVEKELLELTLDQADLFDAPSINVKQVKVERVGASSWTPAIEVPVGIISPSLAHLRVAFTQNRKSGIERSLKNGSRLDGAHLSRLATGDNRIFANRSIPKKRDWFVVIGLDLSGSSAGHTSEVIKSGGFAMGEMLSRLGIGFALYGHTGGAAYRPQYGNEPSALTKSADNVDEYHTYTLQISVGKTANDPWDAEAKGRVAAFDADNCNLDGHTLEFYRRVAMAERATDKLIMYFTDGAMPAANFDEELALLQKNIVLCRKNRIHLVGVGVGNDDPLEHGLDMIRYDRMEDLPKLIHGLEARIN